MKQYPVEITDKALKDMEEIYYYIAINLQSPGNAMGKYDRIAAVAENLVFFPEKYKLVDFEPEYSQGLRRIIIDNYSVFYVFKDEKVTVVRVLFSASDIEKRLSE